MSENPYASPRAASSRASSRPWYHAALLLGGLGSVGAAVAIYLIYVDDPRTGTPNAPSLTMSVAGGALLGGIGWFVAGAVAGMSLARILIAHSTAGFAVAIWILVAGNYSDVLSAAAVVGWPLGGVVGALLARRMRIGSRDKNALDRS